MMAMQVARWNMAIEFTEDDTHTHATAVATLTDATEVRGRGDAFRHPDDSSQPMVGEEIAAARALFNLAGQLLQRASGQIESVTHQTAHLSR
jgi:hypothetical protein